jgi:ribosomal protein S18 acetylase RimI-like enzyme
MFSLVTLYEDILSEPKYDIKKIDNHTTIVLSINHNIIGSASIEKVNNGYNKFEDTMTYDEYIELFGDGSFFELEHIRVNNEFIRMGYGKALMEKTIEVISNYGGKLIYLNASPLYNKIGLTDLVNFYMGFGFKIIPQTDGWIENKEMILKL